MPLIKYSMPTNRQSNSYLHKFLPNLPSILCVSLLFLSLSVNFLSLSLPFSNYISLSFSLSLCLSLNPRVTLSSTSTTLYWLFFLCFLAGHAPPSHSRVSYELPERRGVTGANQYFAKSSENKPTTCNVSKPTSHNYKK